MYIFTAESMKRTLRERVAKNVLHLLLGKWTVACQYPVHTWPDELASHECKDCRTQIERFTVSKGLCYPHASLDWWATTGWRNFLGSPKSTPSYICGNKCFPCVYVVVCFSLLPSILDMILSTHFPSFFTSCCGRWASPFGSKMCMWANEWVSERHTIWTGEEGKKWKSRRLLQ